MKDKIKEKLEKEIEKLRTYVDFYGQIPTLTKSNTKEFYEYITLKAKLKQHEETKKAELKRILKLIKNKKLEYKGLEQIQEAHWVLTTLDWIEKEIGK